MLVNQYHVPGLIGTAEYAVFDEAGNVILVNAFVAFILFYNIVFNFCFGYLKKTTSQRAAQSSHPSETQHKVGNPIDFWYTSSEKGVEY